MQVIVLEGMPDKGKTTTLNLVYDLVIHNGGVSTNRQPEGGDPNDFSDIINYNNKKVAFFTMGDYSTYLANAIYDYNNQNCDVLICALSINTPKIRANNALNHFSANRIPKTVAANLSVALSINTADAKYIFGLI